MQLSLLDLVAIFLAISAGLSWVNLKVFKLPTTIGLLMIGLVGSVGVLALDLVLPSLMLEDNLTGLVARVDFSHALMVFMLGYLLFAGALEVNFAALKGVVWTAAVLATAGVVVSMFLVAFGFWGAAQLLGAPIPFIWALVFGAIISPTDPVAVLAALQRLNIPKDVKALMQAESLFNDGVGVVLFLAVLGVATGYEHVSLPEVVGHVGLEAGGGALLGAVGGLVVVKAMSQIDDYAVEVALTLALATGVYTLAQALALSGPIAVATAGMIVGTEWASGAMSETTQRYVRAFWRLVDENLNAILFLLIGLEVLVLPLDLNYAVLAVVSIPVVLLARLLSVILPAGLLAHARAQIGYAVIPLLTWGGVRGGISVALALTLPAGPERDAIVTCTYAVVLFANLVQALSLPRLVSRLRIDPTAPPGSPAEPAAH